MPDKNTQWIIGSMIAIAVALYAGLNISLNGQIANLNTSVNARIDQLNTNLNARIDQLNTNLNARIDQLNTNLNARIDQLDGRLNRINERLLAVEIRVANIGFRPDFSQPIWPDQPIPPLGPGPDRPIPPMPNATDTERP